MPRTALSVQTIPKNGALDDVVFTAGDAANNHEFVNTGKEIIIEKNENAALKPSTVVSVADPDTGRTGDATLNPTGGSDKTSMAGPFKPPLWSQSGTGLVNVDIADATNVSFAVVRYQE